MKSKTLIVGIIVVAALVSAFIFGRSQVSERGQGAATNLSSISTASLNVGSGCDTSYGTCTGSTVSRINFGTCYVLAYATTIAATSTATVDCQGTAAIGSTNTTLATALTGVTAGDKVVATLSTSTAGSTVAGLSITAASASTTSGYIQLRVYNGTGTTFTWPVTGTATGTASYIVAN